MGKEKGSWWLPRLITWTADGTVSNTKVVIGAVGSGGKAVVDGVVVGGKAVGDAVVGTTTAVGNGVGGIFNAKNDEASTVENDEPTEATKAVATDVEYGQYDPDDAQHDSY